MSFAEKKGIAVASGFKLQAEALLDARESVDTISERDALVTEHAVAPGLKVYVKQTKTLYVYNGDGWDELSKGAGYTHPTGAGYKHIPAGGAPGQILGWKADGEAQWKAEKSYGKATGEADGLMAKEDKKKLDGIDEGANKTVVDSALSDSSVNPLQNKIVKAELDKKLSASLKGTKSGVAELDASGKVPSSQLPSYVDDVIDCWSNWDAEESKIRLYSDSSKKTEITAGEAGKIYVTADTNKTYRWSGSKFAEISASLALGETSSTAYRGDRGKAAYEHSQSPHARRDATKAEKSEQNGFIKINDEEVEVYKHPTHTEKVAGLYKVTVDSQGHISAAEPVQKTDITELGLPEQDTTYGEATQDKAGLMSAEDKKKIDTMPQIYFQSDLPLSAPVGSICFLI
ncbi:MAG: hypothetical protein KH353_04420 [Clostridium sp.]|nr:hypothetical protein [Clostridium sp.]